MQHFDRVDYERFAKKTRKKLKKIYVQAFDQYASSIRKKIRFDHAQLKKGPYYGCYELFKQLKYGQHLRDNIFFMYQYLNPDVYK